MILSRDGNSSIGDLVAALDDRHCVTICKIQGEGMQPVPAIEGAYPAPTKQILGTIVGVVRKF